MSTIFLAMRTIVSLYVVQYTRPLLRIYLQPYVYSVSVQCIMYIILLLSIITIVAGYTAYITFIIYNLSWGDQRVIQDVQYRPVKTLTIYRYDIFKTFKLNDVPC